MGAGKSSVGRWIAHHHNIPFVDLDQLIESRVRKSVSEIFAEQGEHQFRAMERETLLELLEDPERQVVALGGGTLLQRPLRMQVLSKGVVVWLQTSFATAFARIERSKRPLVKLGEAGLLALWEDRKRFYAESHASIRTDHRRPGQSGEEVLEVWRQDPEVVAAWEKSCPVVVTNELAPLPSWIRRSNPSAQMVLTDSNVEPLYRERFAETFGEIPTFVFQAGEEHKHIDSLKGAWEAALQHRLDRKSMIIGVGGGVVTDKSGFVASTWMRGIPWVSVPTTLLGMIDAGIGGKTGVDFADIKNALGAFHQPSVVWIDVSFCKTEDDRYFRSGFAEVVKTALIGDAGLLDVLEAQTESLLARDPTVLREVVRRCVRVKAGIVSRDEKEQGERALLNLGHTLGHALESMGQFVRWTHGEAISLGLIGALRAGVSLGKTAGDLAKRVEALLAKFGLPVELKAEDVRASLSFVGHDKKRQADKVKFIWVEAAGTCQYHLMQVNELTDLFAQIADPAIDTE
jgi:shikimate kinase / 3-dehydroquinate synthase